MKLLETKEITKPSSTRIITVSNQKGGVGKTTTTVNIAAAMAKHGLNVLVIDADPQGNASTALGVEHQVGTPSIYEVIVDNKPIEEVIQKCSSFENLYVCPSTIDLSGAEIELVSATNREFRLKNSLQNFLQKYKDFDFVFIDCPPSLGLMTVNSFTAAKEVLIPIQCEYYALEGLSLLLNSIEMIRTNLNPDLKLSTILLTMFDKRTNLSQEVAEEVRNYFPDDTLEVEIPRSVKIAEAPSYGQTVITYSEQSVGSLAYQLAAFEIAGR
ncbi:ParA family protein [Actinomyces sp. zg-332]|nr:ParA family protein [Actinomyces sp. zg-332]